MSRQVDLRQTNLATLQFANEDFNSSNNCFETNNNSWTRPSNASIDNFTENVTITAREIISDNRRPQRGENTGQTVSTGYRNNLTLESIENIAAGFFLMSGFRRPYSRLRATGVDPSNNNLTGLTEEYGTAISAATAANLPSGALIQVRNSDLSTQRINNGVLSWNDLLHQVDTAAAANDTTLEVTTNTANLVAETGQNLRVSVVGKRLTASGQSWSYNTLTKEATMNSTGHGLAAMGLQVGMLVYIGSPDFLDPTKAALSNSTFTSTQSNTVYQNGFTNASSNDMTGGAVVKRITTDTVVFGDPDLELQQNSTGGSTVDILFGTGFQDIDGGSSFYKDPRFTFELGTRPNFNSTYEYELIRTAVLSAFSLASPETGLTNITSGYIGTLLEEVTSRNPNAATAQREIWKSGIAAANNVHRVNVRNLSGSELTTGLRNVNVTADNGRSPIQIYGSPYPIGFNLGQFNFTLSATILFTSREVLNAVKNGASTNFYNRYANRDGLIDYRIPEMEIQSTPRQFQVGQAISQTLNCRALESTIYNQASSLNIIPVPQRL